MVAMFASGAAETIPDQAVYVVKKTILRSLSRNGDLTPEASAKVHQAVDLLKASQPGSDSLPAMEKMSCELLRLSHLRREGRVNAYASGLLRLRKVVEAL